MPRPYVAEDERTLKAMKKADLVALVRADISRWPYKGFNASKLNKRALYEVLLDPTNGFLTELAPPSGSPSSPSHIPDSVAPPSSQLVFSVPEMPTPSAPPQRSPHVGSSTLTGVSSAPVLTPSTSSSTKPGNMIRPLKVYIIDNNLGDVQKTVQNIEVRVADHDGCKPGEWRASAMEIIQMLQASHAVIRSGFVKIGIPDEVSPEFIEWFVDGDTSFLEAMTMRPDRLKVSAKSTLTLHITTSQPKAPFSKRLHHYQEKMGLKTFSDDESDLTSSSAKRQKVAISPESKPLEVVRKRLHQEDLHWLTDTIQKRPGYADFNRNRNRRLQNPDVVAHWAFAAQVSVAYYRKPSGAAISSPRLITKNLIYQALGVRETWLSEAEEGYRMVGIYGKDGTHPAEEVIRVLATKQNPPIGAVKLLKFLRNWNSRNPAII